MLINHVHDALAQVREIQQRVVESRRFQGYSGRARAISGLVALVTAAVLAREDFPESNYYHFLGWGFVFLFAVTANYGALLIWYRSLPPRGRDARVLLPMLDSLAPLAVGGIISLGMIIRNDFTYLFGIWMCLFGLANMSARTVLPKGILWVGILYITAGLVCFLHPAIRFTNPWPMGITFAVGEVIGGYLLFADQADEPSFSAFLCKSINPTKEAVAHNPVDKC